MIDDQIFRHEETIKTNNVKKEKMNLQTINPKSKHIEA